MCADIRPTARAGGKTITGVVEMKCGRHCLASFCTPDTSCAVSGLGASQSLLRTTLVWLGGGRYQCGKNVMSMAMSDCHQKCDSQQVRLASAT